MSKKQKTMRLIISGTLLAAVALVGVSVYQVDMSQKEQLEEINEVAEAQEQTQDEEMEPIQGGNSTAQEDDTEPHHAVIEDEEEEIPERADVSSDEVTAQMENQAETGTETVETESTEAASETAAQSAVVPDVNFTGEVLMNWPVEGEVLMDYSMDRTVYFETLNVYKYNPSLLIGAEVGTPVEAATNLKVISIEEDLETGTTITADLGNGYQAVYGQLKDVAVAENDVVTAGTVLGYISEPTKYYTNEGANLYFSMTKDGESVDPVLYLP